MKIVYINQFRNINVLIGSTSKTRLGIKFKLFGGIETFLDENSNKKTKSGRKKCETDERWFNMDDESKTVLKGLLLHKF